MSSPTIERDPAIGRVTSSIFRPWELEMERMGELLSDGISDVAQRAALNLASVQVRRIAGEDVEEHERAVMSTLGALRAAMSMAAYGAFVRAARGALLGAVDALLADPQA